MEALIRSKQCKEENSQDADVESTNKGTEFEARSQAQRLKPSVMTWKWYQNKKLVELIIRFQPHFMNSLV